jgi:hypothetical protein
LRGDWVEREESRIGRAEYEEIEMNSGEAADEQVIAVLLCCHEAECGRCYTGKRWRSAALLEVRETVERAWWQLGALAMQERWN